MTESGEQTCIGKMFGKVTPEKVWRFNTICARIGACLPPPASAGASQMKRYKILWWTAFSFVNINGSSIAYDLYLNLEDVNNVLTNVSELCPLYTGLLKILLCRYYTKQLQECFLDVKSFFKAMNNQERALLQRYVDERIGFYYFMLTCICFTLVAFCCAPALSSQMYPAHASYPFKVNTRTLRNILRVEHMLGLLQVAVLATIDFIFSFLIWATAARFELLANEFSQVSDKKTFNTCIQKHQKLLESVEKLDTVIGPVAFVLTISTTIGTVCAGIQILLDTPLLGKMRLVTFVVAGILELFVYVWPAEKLLEHGDSICFAVYSTDWTGQSSETKHLVLMVMQRTNKPPTITFGRVIPPLSLNFYGTFVTSAFSYFTTLRAATATGT